MERVRRFYLKI